MGLPMLQMIFESSMPNNGGRMPMLMITMRDKRTMNHMDGDTKLVHLRLEAWGEWAKQHESIGYPAITPIGRMMEYGPMGAAQEGRPPVSMPDEIAATDAAVARLGAIDRKAVTEYYTRWEAAEVIARRCGLRVRQFQSVLRRARWRLLGMLG